MDTSALLSDLRESLTEAGRIACRVTDLDIQEKGAQNFVTQADFAVNAYLNQRLTALFLGARLLTEESKDHTFSPDGYTWVVDPIDGTSNFIFDMHLSCISVGLLRGEKPILGAVYNPFTQEMFTAAEGDGACLNDKPIQVRNDGDLKGALILLETNPYGDRASDVTPKVIRSLFRQCVDYRVLGSAALDICYVACGRGSAFISEVLWPWDYAAAKIILEEAGGTCSRWDGCALTFDRKQTFAAAGGALHKTLLGLLPDA